MERNTRRVLTGVVVSNTNDKTPLLFITRADKIG